MFRYVNESQAIHHYLPHVDLNGLATASRDDGSGRVFRVPHTMLHDYETSMSTPFGPRFAWLSYPLGYAALCSVATGFGGIVRHGRQDLRIPALSIVFATMSVLAYVAVYVAFPIATPVRGQPRRILWLVCGVVGDAGEG